MLEQHFPRLPHVVPLKFTPQRPSKDWDVPPIAYVRHSPDWQPDPQCSVDVPQKPKIQSCIENELAILTILTTTFALRASISIGLNTTRPSDRITDLCAKKIALPFR